MNNIYMHVKCSIIRCLFLLMMIAAVLPDVNAQQYLHAGFDKQEYLDVLSVTSQVYDSPNTKDSIIPAPLHYTRTYRSVETALDNRWDLWTRDDGGVAVISIRGTTLKAISWIENFYAAMVPAQGSLQLNDSTIFSYTLADNPRATVHVGWLTGLATMATDITSHIKEAYQHGTHEFLIVGHSQGGALSMLLRSYLFYEKVQGRLPADIYFKTYASAAPKPGNTYFAYDYEYNMRGGWSFTIVNELDWVPETPFSLQRIDDFNAVNPFGNAKQIFKKQKLLVRWYLTHKYNSLSRLSKKSPRKFTKLLGPTMYKQIKKALPQFKQPEYTNTSNYVRTGTPIVLKPDSAYNRLFIFDGKDIFIHHMPRPYYYLAKKW